MITLKIAITLMIIGSLGILIGLIVEEDNEDSIILPISGFTIALGLILLGIYGVYEIWNI